CFFSSRRRHTRSYGDWSSDVCSSDLLLLGVMKFQSVQPELAYLALLVVGAFEFFLAQLPITKRRRQAFVVLSVVGATLMLAAVRSEERRVGQERRSECARA